MLTAAEGLVLGMGAKIFTVAGPVLLYGTLAGALYGGLLDNTDDMKGLNFSPSSLI